MHHFSRFSRYSDDFSRFTEHIDIVHIHNTVKLVPERGGMGAVAVEAWGKESGVGAAGEAAGALTVGNTIRARLRTHSLPSSSRGTYSPCASAA